MAAPSEGFLARLDSVMARLQLLAVRTPTSSLTRPDPKTGEQWDAGQVWAHLAEFPSFWLSGVRKVLVQKTDEPVPFGRVASDPSRIAAIERDRNVPPSLLLAQVEAPVAELRALLERLRGRLVGAGTALDAGDMDLACIIDEFLVGHLEQHAGQLEDLARREGGEASP